MAKQLAGVYERVLSCAKSEFLEKGFNDASLRTIARNAKTSTSSIYTRFSDKEGLFKALVYPVVDRLKAWFVNQQEDFSAFSPQNQKEQVFSYSDERLTEFVNYVYGNLDLFVLLLLKSEGTEFSRFIHDLVEADVAYTVRFLEATGYAETVFSKASAEFLHILSNAFYSGIFEIVVHSMTKEEALSHVHKLRRFFMRGYQDLFEG